MLSVADVMEKSKEIINMPYYCPIIRNKGSEGLYLEKLLGIEPSSKCLDLCDGEVKCFPTKKLKNRTLSPKETIAITMMNPEDLRTQTFEESRCYTKIRRVIFFPYLRKEEYITFMKPIFIEISENHNIFEQIQIDYNTIRNEIVEKGVVHSKTGKYIQSRTKGRGKVKEGGKKTRAFYFKTKFVKDFILVHSILPPFYNTDILLSLVDRPPESVTIDTIESIII